MSSIPPTVADLEAEVVDICGRELADVGLYLRALDGGDPARPITPTVRRGIRIGVAAVGCTLADPLHVQDSDLARLSPFAIERVLDEAQLYSLQQVLAHWYRATQADQEALAAMPMQGGWKADEKQALRDRVARLKVICDEPYREPSTPTVVAANRYPAGYHYGYGFDIGAECRYGYGPGYGYWPGGGWCP